MPFTIEFHFRRAGQRNFPETIPPDSFAERPILRVTPSGISEANPRIL